MAATATHFLRRFGCDKRGILNWPNQLGEHKTVMDNRLPALPRNDPLGFNPHPCHGVALVVS
jgi:hypothetical protein